MNNFFKFLVLTLLSTSLLRAQDTGEDRLGAWYMYFGTNQVSEKFSIHTEAQFRLFEVSENFNQLLLRTGVNYHLSTKAMATLGYAYIDTDSSFESFPEEEHSIEHRIYQQFILRNNLSKFKFEHRYRLEQRFISFYEGDDVQHRARYRLQVTYPLSEQWFLSVYDEIFINLQDDIFGQNRLYAAIGRVISPKLSIQLGYLKNHFAEVHYDRLQIGVFFNTDLR